jgi:hypothetical protein
MSIADAANRRGDAIRAFGFYRELLEQVGPSPIFGDIYGTHCEQERVWHSFEGGASEG